MACQRCDHTMQNLWADAPNRRRIFWCPRCGSIKVQWMTSPTEIETTECESPKLVDYVRHFLKCDDENVMLPQLLTTEVAIKELKEAVGWNLQREDHPY